MAKPGCAGYVCSMRGSLESREFHLPTSFKRVCSPAFRSMSANVCNRLVGPVNLLAIMLDRATATFSAAIGCEPSDPVTAMVSMPIGGQTSVARQLTSSKLRLWRLEKVGARHSRNRRTTGLAESL
jgi:hypothetical protein